MSLSVVIPLYNKGQYIKRALKSILAQTVAPFEIIVVDDGSTDGGGEIAQSFQDPGIRLIRQENQGVSVARNRGVEEARGDLIAFLDADDAWKPRFIEVILELSKQYPQAGAYATAYERISPYGIIYHPKFKILPEGSKQGLIDFFKTAKLHPVWTSAVAVPKKVLEEIGGFQECIIRAEDVDAWLKIALRYPIAWSSEYLATYYQNVTYRSINVTWTAGEPAISRTAREAIRSGLVPSEYLGYLKEHVARFQIAAARRCLILGNRGQALELLGYSSGTQEYARAWTRLRLMAALPVNVELWLWKLRMSLKQSFPGLARRYHKRQLKGLTE